MKTHTGKAPKRRLFRIRDQRAAPRFTTAAPVKTGLCQPDAGHYAAVERIETDNWKTPYVLLKSTPENRKQVR
jgi:hypothetical protein